MRKAEHREGPEATENFEWGMKVLFHVPKPSPKKRKLKDKPALIPRKPKSSDREVVPLRRGYSTSAPNSF